LRGLHIATNGEASLKNAKEIKVLSGTNRNCEGARCLA
jgi:hypothetical protein